MRLAVALAVVAACSDREPAAVPRPGPPTSAVPLDGPTPDAAARDARAADTSWTHTHDLDGDGKPDAVAVGYTGGAHCCYRLAVTLSTTGKIVPIPFELDGGYPDGLTVDRPESFALEVAPTGTTVLVMRVATYSGRPERIPLDWVRTFGARSHRIAVSLRGGVLRVENRGWSCDAALEALLQRRLDVWEGWPATCAWGDLLTGLDVTSTADNDVTLGSARATASFDRVSPLVSHDARRITLAIYRRDGRIVRIDVDEAVLGGEAAPLIGALGPPEVRLPYTLWGFTHPNGQWLWPSRGLAVYVDRASARIHHAAVFTPTDLATYKRELSWP
jgi:hypothetical protein